MKVIIAVDLSEVAKQTFDWYVKNLHRVDNEVFVCHQAEQPDFSTLLIAGTSAFPQYEVDKVTQEYRRKQQEVEELYNSKAKKHQRHLVNGIIPRQQHFNNWKLHSVNLGNRPCVKSLCKYAKLPETTNQGFVSPRIKIQKPNQVQNFKILIELTRNDPGHSIVKRAEEIEADMIVIGTRGMGAIRRTILGSVSDYVVHHSKIPVVICHGQKA